MINITKVDTESYSRNQLNKAMHTEDPQLLKVPVTNYKISIAVPIFHHLNLKRNENI